MVSHQTCKYRRHEGRLNLYKHDVERERFVEHKLFHVFYAQTYSPNTFRGRSTLKDDIVNERAFPSGSFRELKIKKESKNLPKVLLESL